MADRKYRIHEHVVPGRPLGRHVNHDPRSLAYRVEPDGTVATVRWERVTPVLDQGDLGSCTGNATAGVLGSQPFHAYTSKTVFDENFAVQIYSAATKIDAFDGVYPPTDTGSDGLSVAKAAKQWGFISGYQHITSLAAAHTAIQAGPFITGVNWYSGMDEPDADGVVSVSGTVRGGHEFEIVGYDAATGLWEAVNSWGPGWGVGGHFFIPDAGYARLLAEQGDATVFVPLNQPAPVPTPEPTPTPPPVPAGNPFPIEQVKGWLTGRHYGAAKTAQTAILAWLKAGGH